MHVHVYSVNIQVQRDVVLMQNVGMMLLVDILVDEMLMLVNDDHVEDVVYVEDTDERVEMEVELEMRVKVDVRELSPHHHVQHDLTYHHLIVNLDMSHMHHYYPHDVDVVDVMMEVDELQDVDVNVDVDVVVLVNPIDVFVVVEVEHHLHKDHV